MMAGAGVTILCSVVPRRGIASACRRPRRAVLKPIDVAGALADPFLELHNAQGTTIMSNNDWHDARTQELSDTTIPPSNAKESALVTNLTLVIT
jgi:hypothetical protein